MELGCGPYGGKETLAASTSDVVICFMRNELRRCRLQVLSARLYVRDQTWCIDVKYLSAALSRYATLSALAQAVGC